MCVTPTKIATATGEICGMTIDAANVYWMDANANRIKKTPLSGGSSSEIATVAMDGSCFVTIAVDATNVYWTNPSWDLAHNHASGGGRVMKSPIGGGTATSLYASSQNIPTAIAVQGMNVYWVNDNPGSGPMAQSNGTLMTVPTAGGTPTTLVTGLGLMGGIAVNAENAFWTDYLAGAVMQAPLAGGTAVEIASGAEPQPIALDATHVYWGESSSKRIMKAPLAGGPAVQIALDTDAPRAIAVDSTTVYWVTATALKKAPIDGGAPAVVAMAGGPFEMSVAPRVAVDAANVYWTAHVNNNDAIFRAPK